MKQKRLILSIAMMILMLFSVMNIYAEAKDGWRGYGLFILNDGTTIENEEVTLSFSNGKLSYEGQYMIKNNTAGDIKAVLGIPDSYIAKVSVAEGGAALKYKKRTLGGITAEFSLKETIPQEEKWYTYTIAIKANETKTVSISFEASAAMDAADSYRIDYFGDRSSGYKNTAKSSKLNIKLSDYKPYSIISLEGASMGQINEEGGLSLAVTSANADKIGISYQPVEQLAIERLQQSPYKKPKEIAYFYNAKAFDKVIQLCDEYLSNPVDKQLDINQIAFIKAESYRLLQKNEEYLTAIAAVDIHMVYPANASYKVLLDKAAIYQAMNKESERQAAEEELINTAKANNEALYEWLGLEGYIKEEAPPADTDNNVEQEAEAEDKPDKKNTEQMAARLIAAFEDFKYDWAVTFAVGLLIGLLIGRGNSKRRRKSSMYLFRR